MGKRPLLILGFGGNAVDAIDTIERQFEIVGFIDDAVTGRKDGFENIPVLTRQALSDYPDAQVITLIGSERTISRRRDIIASFEIPPERFATVIHPNATVSRLATIGHDVIVFGGVVITSNAKIGNHIFILPNTVLHHDVSVGDFSLLGSGVVLAGHVRIGESCYLGSASSVRQDVQIGSGSIVGMAANVLRDVEAGTVVVGNPARPVPGR